MVRYFHEIVQCPGGTVDEPSGLFDSIGNRLLEWSSMGVSFRSLFEEGFHAIPFVDDEAPIEMLE